MNAPTDIHPAHPHRASRRSAVLASVLVLALLPLVGQAAASTLEQRLSTKKQQRERIEGQLEQSREREQVLTSRISEFRRRIEQLNGPIADLDAEITRLEAEIQAGRERLARLRDEREALAVRLRRLEAELQVAEQRLLNRLVDIYVSGGQGGLSSALVPGDTFSDWVDRQEVVGRIAEKDDEIMTSVDRLRGGVDRDRQRTRRLEASTREQVRQVEADEAAVQERRAELVARRSELEGVKAEREGYLERVREQQQDMHRNLKSLEEDSKALEAAIASGQQAASAGVSVPAGPGPSGLAWPVSGPVVSPFGPRWGRLHAGIDIAAPAGTPIYAAAAGVVTYAGWMGGYGNLVIVQHGGNLATAYAHMSTMASAVGQVVTQGQLLGYVGCTGHCYGDHLHYETRLGGVAVDPMRYY